MPQRLKPEVRERILSAAATVFAEQGYEKAKLSEVADRAGTATSNLYKYFENKELLFEALVTPQLAARFLRLLRAHLREFTLSEHWAGADAQGSRNARALLAFWVEQRNVTLILLRGASGTRYAHVRGLMIHEMERLASDFLKEKSGNAVVTPQMQVVLHSLFSQTVETIADILAEYEDATSIEQAVSLFWQYQLAGLEALLKP